MALQAWLFHECWCLCTLLFRDFFLKWIVFVYILSLRFPLVGPPNLNFKFFAEAQLRNIPHLSTQPTCLVKWITPWFMTLSQKLTLILRRIKWDCTSIHNFFQHVNWTQEYRGIGLAGGHGGGEGRVRLPGGERLHWDHNRHSVNLGGHLREIL